ncbi:beta-ketoacyl-[acyl-carrier-protein] synthase family protein [Streptomyces roseus]|uniref:Beta-ketoacyl-[acyl-carrier-protein] synthase III N-terminal domain-containing protein n=1 Tax=Streptomyces roseus TaxID=66430 RepID=A0A0J6XH90_9ACTN|nr:hypothetical protein [Streptomyces roseus]KMO93557.1 hypothetical protein ACS04_34135 [Streptomyces roseus]
MGMVIAAARTTTHHGTGPASAVELASRAARACLARAQVSPSSVGVLINVGVYRESNTFEPALAALVQKEVGVNLDYTADPAPASGFSFDLMNGACGVLNAVQLAQSLLDTAGAERVLITAADVHPGGDARRDPDYPYADLGGALLLQRSAAPGAGFGPVSSYAGDGPSDTEGYLDTAATGGDGRSRITVRRTEGHGARRAALAAACTAGYAREHGIDLDRTLVVGPGAGERARDEGEPHTAAPILGYLRAVAAPRPRGRDRLLLVAAGAGPSAACVSYRPEGW